MVLLKKPQYFSYRMDKKFILLFVFNKSPLYFSYRMDKMHIQKNGGEKDLPADSSVTLYSAAIVCYANHIQAHPKQKMNRTQFQNFDS